MLLVAACSMIVPLCGRADPRAELDFRIMGAASDSPGDSPARARWLGTARDLNFTVLGPRTGREPARPLVIVYPAPAGIACEPCRQLARHAAELPYAFEWRPAPEWVESFPTLHWQAADGRWRKCEGWPGADRFQLLFDASQRPARD